MPNTQTTGSAVTTLIEQAKTDGLLEEAKYSAQQLRDLLAKGHALRNDDGDPSYPIDDEEDLRRAIHAVGRGKTGHDRIRKYIRGRAKAMGKSDMIPDTWGSSGAMKESALAETTPLTEAMRGTPTGRRMQIQLVTPGWGSSGHYSETVLKQAAADRVFAAGTPMYINHQRLSEAADRPHGERSVEDLAARFAEDARWDGNALVAEVEVTNPVHRPVLAEMADHIGVSIRAVGQAEMGEAEGREGLIVQSIDRALSVDFVAEAGRGGKVLALLESKRAELAEARNVGAWLEARLHTAFTELTDGMYGDGRLTREERISLSSGIGDALAAFTTRIEADAPQLYERDPWADPERAAAMEESTSKGGQPPHTTSKEAPVTGTNTTGTPAPNDTGGAPIKAPELVEAEKQVTEYKTKLEEAQGQVKALSDNAVRADRAEQRARSAEAETARLRGMLAARDRLATKLAESGLPEASFGRVTAVVCGHEGRAVPLTESAAVDEEKLDQAITAAVDSERTYIAALAEAAGTGVPRGLGGGQEREFSESDFEAEMEKLFLERGMSPEAAKVAARGRG